MTAASPAKVFFLYPDSLHRREIFQEGRYGSRKFYLLQGRDAAASHGIEASDDLDICDRLEGSAFGKFFDRAANKLMAVLGGYGGYWYKVLALRARLARAEAVLSANDRVGIPLVLLMHWGLLPRRPIVYVSIGLPFRLDRLNGFFKRRFRAAFRRNVSAVVAYGQGEARALEGFFGPGLVRFIPFCADVDMFSPGGAPPEGPGPALFIGQDDSRDYELLFKIAPRIPRPVHVITLEGKLPAAPLPANVTVEYRVPFDRLPALMREAEVVVLPVRENPYSGATTTLLQAMSVGKPVVVSRTAAISDGYGLEDGKNVFLSAPGDAEGFLAKTLRLLNEPALRARMGGEARRMVVERHSYQRYCADILGLVKEAAGRP